MADQYAVIGFPVKHSKSPLIHAEFARQTHQDLDYHALESTPDQFVATVQQFIAAGGKGMNVTVPFKENAYELANTCHPLAQQAEAVNTLKFLPNGDIEGYNTDGIGLVRDLTENLEIELQKCSVLILGAGGSVRGILPSLLSANPRQMCIANRTKMRAIELAKKFDIAGCGLNELNDRKFDLIINATSASLTGETPLLPANILVSGGHCYDLMYSDRATAFVRWGKDHGAAISTDGFGMLVEQAAESFFIWRGIRPNAKAVIQLLRPTA